MPNNYFKFKEFTVQQSSCNMKVCTDSCLFGAWAADDISKYKKNDHKVLDIGAGTGLLSLMIAQLNINAKILSVEIHSPSALQAKENFENSPWKQNLKIIESGILEFNSKEKFDIIISNPPFFAKSLKSPNSSKNETKHETDLSLMLLINYIKENLKEDGISYILLANNREDEAIEIIKTNNLSISKLIRVRQKEGGDFFRIIIKITKENLNKSQLTEINIKLNNNNYSDEFINLLKPYYLFL